MKALVTGATGFVGSHLVEALRHHGHEVTALVRSPARGAVLAHLGVRLVEGDLGDDGALDRAAAGQDVVFHVAGLIAARNEAEFFRVNRDGTASVTGAAAGGGVGPSFAFKCARRPKNIRTTRRPGRNRPPPPHRRPGCEGSRPSLPARSNLRSRHARGS